MPIKKCQLNGSVGYKWGDAGVCYVGTDAKSKAIAQGTAALVSEAKKVGATNKREIDAYLEEHKKELS